jgi:hypothetical protein
LREFAEAVNRDRSHVRRRIRKAGIEFVRIRTEQSGGQIELALTPEELEKAKALYTYGVIDSSPQE